MSNRTLLEFNHDISDEATASALGAQLIEFMMTGELKILPKGVTFLGTRHHSEPNPKGYFQSGLPITDHDGGWWWFKPASVICCDPRILYVRWFRGAVKALWGDKMTKVTEMQGEWCGPIPLPDGWQNKQEQPT